MPPDAPPRINVQLVSDEERRLMHAARAVSAARGEPLRDFVLRALRHELDRQRQATPDLMAALDRLREQSGSSAASAGNGAYTGANAPQTTP